ncbi:hypothetical protein V5O48_002593 [Marasmius crinis-equi]|uniref:PAP-associated domain-containing protein n=1 Tax=Marasmius crinis-equi TaxID=585013 RepID=A0ABR3FVD1_9AGAR
MVIITGRKFGHIGVDITANTTDGPQCVKIVKNYISTMPALRSLILILKVFLKERRLSDASLGGLSSYALTCMVISFLQLNPKKRPQEYFDKPFKTESLGILLTDFMMYYGRDFSYQDSFISVLQSKLIPKSSVPWLSTHDALAIECLVRDRNNVSRPTRNLKQIRSAFKEAAGTLLQLSLTDRDCLSSIVKFKDLDAVRPTSFSFSTEPFIKSERHERPTLLLPSEELQEPSSVLLKSDSDPPASPYPSASEFSTPIAPLQRQPQASSRRHPREVASKPATAVLHNDVSQSPLDESGAATSESEPSTAPAPTEPGATASDQ